MNSANTYIGKGLSFPLLVTSGKVESTGGFDLLESSIYNIISWPLSHRYFERTFGSNLYQLLKEPNDSVVMVLAREYIIEALAIWDTRIEVVDVLVDQEEYGSFEVTVIFSIKATREVKELVIPIYTG